MSIWTVYYGDQGILTGLSERTKSDLADQILSILEKGEFGWLSVAEPGEPGVHQILVGPGISFMFQSVDAIHEPHAFDSGEQTILLGGPND